MVQTALSPAVAPVRGSEFACQPGSVVPSMMKGWLMTGRDALSLIVCMPEGAMLKLMVESGSASALAWVMAQRKLPALPSSSVFVTTKIAGAVRPSRASR